MRQLWTVTNNNISWNIPRIRARAISSDDPRDEWFNTFANRIQLQCSDDEAMNNEPQVMPRQIQLSDSVDDIPSNEIDDLETNDDFRSDLIEESVIPYDPNYDLWILNDMSRLWDANEVNEQHNSMEDYILFE